MNPPIPIFYSGKDGLLEVKEGPDVKRSGSDRSSNGVQGSDQAGKLASHELVLLVQHDHVEALAKQLLGFLPGTRNCILTLLT